MVPAIKAVCGTQEVGYARGLRRFCFLFRSRSPWKHGSDSLEESAGGYSCWERSSSENKPLCAVSQWTCFKSTAKLYTSDLPMPLDVFFSSPIDFFEGRIPCHCNPAEFLCASAGYKSCHLSGLVFVISVFFGYLCACCSGWCCAFVFNSFIVIAWQNPESLRRGEVLMCLGRSA